MSSGNEADLSTCDWPGLCMVRRERAGRIVGSADGDAAALIASRNPGRDLGTGIGRQLPGQSGKAPAESLSKQSGRLSAPLLRRLLSGFISGRLPGQSSRLPAEFSGK